MNLKTIGLLLGFMFSYSQCNPISLAEQKQPFSIEEALLGQLSINSYSGKWISDQEIEFMDRTTKDIKVFNVAKNQTQVVVKASVLQKFNTTNYQFSPDRQYVLLTYDAVMLFRHSANVKFTVYSVKEGKYFGNDEYVQTVRWNPKTNSLVFIKDNDIYIIRDINIKMEAIRITKDGRPGVVFNGIGDWVYEEEILSSGTAFWFSPEGDQLAFLTLFDTDVKKETIPEYREPADLKNQYTNQVNISYPKAGSRNPTYELRHVFINNTQNVKVVSKCSPGNEIFYSLKWIKNDAVTFVQTNRVQNESRISLCTVGIKVNCTLLKQERNPKGWANTNLLTVSKNYDRFIRIEGVPVGKLGNFKHLMLYKENNINYPLTGGPSEVLKVVAWNENKRIIYFTGTEENSAPSTQVYAVSETKGSKPVCLTCQIKSPEGRNCKNAGASFSTNFTYVIIHCHGPQPRVVYLFKNDQPLGKPLAVLEGNSELRSQLMKKLMPEVMNLTVEVPGPFKADVRLLLPPNMDRSGKTKYPLVIDVYGGPASKKIDDAFTLNLGLYMTTNMSVIYGMIDGRNTLKKGENMLFAGYRALGTFEMEDQINVTRSLQKMFPFIDSSRTGIWGWSYGGYATTKVLEIDRQNVFKCGIAVAPVADWIYYDSMYTERYMGLPQENPKGYEAASVLKDFSNLRNKQYLLIHGNADDNVHYQNAMMIAKVLERNNIPFDLMSYPDEDHGLKNVRKHLYYTMSRFWKKCFNLCK